MLLNNDSAEKGRGACVGGNALGGKGAVNSGDVKLPGWVDVDAGNGRTRPDDTGGTTGGVESEGG